MRRKPFRRYNHKIVKEYPDCDPCTDYEWSLEVTRLKLMCSEINDYILDEESDQYLYVAYLEETDEFRVRFKKKPWMN